MLRLAPWLVLWGFKTDVRLALSLVLWDFKTDGWPPVPISKASPGPKNVVGAGFSHAAAGAMAGFMGFQN